LAPRPARPQPQPAYSDPFENDVFDEDGNLIEEGAIDSSKTSPGSDQVCSKELKKQVAAVLASVVGQGDEQPDPELRALLEVRPDTQQGPIFVNMRCTIILLIVVFVRSVVVFIPFGLPVCTYAFVRSPLRIPTGLQPAGCVVRCRPRRRTLPWLRIYARSLMRFRWVPLRCVDLS
jgi:hypothetical protein